MTSDMKRIKVKLKQPNPLFEKWLQEWKDEAAAKGSDMQYCFGKALTSLRKYPLPLSSGRDCGILQNFGNRLCVMLDRKLAEYKKLNPEETCTAHRVNEESPQKLDPGQSENKSPQKNKKQKALSGNKRQSSSSRNVKKNPGEYIPSYRSGAYAILLGLLEAKRKEEYTGFVAKSELIKLAQPLCDSSFTRPEAGSYYTAWSSMSSLVKKGFVSSVGRGKYSLTADGENLAQKIENVDLNDVGCGMDDDVCDITDKPIMENHMLSSCSSKTKSNEVPPPIISSTENPKIVAHEENTIIFAPWSFDVILLVDTQESSGVAGRKGKCDSALNDLHKHNVVFEVRHLKIGDFTWICRDRKTGQEVVLPYVIERKRIDDFAQSIMDGRFREQKFRLKQCGIPNLIYLVEKHGKESHTALPLETLNQAATNTEVTDGFIVKYTGNHKESALYLAHFSHYLGSLFMGKTLLICKKKDMPSFSVNDDMISLMSFQEFNSSSMKNKKLVARDMFIKHLIQLNGLSVDKALAIVERYPTPYSLYKALKKEGDSTFLSNITYGRQCRRIGPVLSKSVYDLYNKSSLS